MCDPSTLKRIDLHVHVLDRFLGLIRASPRSSVVSRAPLPRPGLRYGSGQSEPFGQPRPLPKRRPSRKRDKCPTRRPPTAARTAAPRRRPAAAEAGEPPQGPRGKVTVRGPGRPPDLLRTGRPNRPSRPTPDHGGNATPASGTEHRDPVPRSSAQQLGRHRAPCFGPERWPPHRTAPHRTAPHRTAPHRTAPHRTAPHRTDKRGREPARSQGPGANRASASQGWSAARRHSAAFAARAARGRREKVSGIRVPRSPPRSPSHRSRPEPPRPAPVPPPPEE
jgi:hypothetical protein